MTTEIAILNKSAVALAADSAATVSGETVKVFNTANKLFALSKYHPIGIMVYGSAELMGVGWETIIKMYRQQLGAREYDSLDEYAADFVEFVEHRAKEFFPSTEQAKYVARVANEQCSLLAEAANLRISDIVNEGGHVDNKTLKSLVTTAVKKRFDEIRRGNLLGCFQAGMVGEIVAEYSSAVDEVAKIWFSELDLSSKTQSLFRQISLRQ